MIIVKVGGSLYDMPQLGSHLQAFLQTLAPEVIRIMPGGGQLADVIRLWDRIHGLGEDTAHGLAVHTLHIAAQFLRHLLGAHAPPSALEGLDWSVLPARWAVTSDSLAARAAWQFGARQLILLKSVDIPAGTSWEQAAAWGWVDPFFPQAVAAAPFGIVAINFRRWCARVAAAAEATDTPQPGQTGRLV
jgi:aspartokinase-like uncharacterized kinase